MQMVSGFCQSDRSRILARAFWPAHFGLRFAGI
jgi:hypothetical protein